MATTTAALRRHDHRFVSAGGKPDVRRLLSLSAVMGSFEDICYGRGPMVRFRSDRHQGYDSRTTDLFRRVPTFLRGLVAARLPAEGAPVLSIRPCINAAAPVRFSRQSANRRYGALTTFSLFAA